MKLILKKPTRPPGCSPPQSDVPTSIHLKESLLRQNEASLPELSELDVVRHLTELSRRNFGVDTNFYPLGSCTMKYNPKAAEVVASLTGFANLHPLLPSFAREDSSPRALSKSSMNSTCFSAKLPA